MLAMALVKGAASGFPFVAQGIKRCFDALAQGSLVLQLRYCFTITINTFWIMISNACSVSESLPNRSFFVAICLSGVSLLNT